ncbi:MAG: glucan biosynthesis protein C [Glaciecola sp.]|jgi:glucan biosynthesis protein C
MNSIPLISVALLLHAWDVLADLKFPVVCSTTVLLCLWPYQAFVRKGRIGEILNGRRNESVPWKSR